MTEPDEALIWARQHKEYRAALQGLMADAYRAGQAASAERIKALEEAIRRLTNMLAESDDPPGLIMVVTKDLLDARALLKEADQ
jgi:hypothetical protein